MGRSLLILLLGLAMMAGSAQDETPRARFVRYKELGEIVADIARIVKDSPAKEPVVVWLIDNSTQFQNLKQGELLADAIVRHFPLGETRHAVVGMTAAPVLLLKGTNDPSKVAGAIKKLQDAPPDDSIKNCLLHIRESAMAASAAGGKAGAYIVLFTLENSDNEDDVEATVALLKKTGATLLPITGEAIYSDPYWAGVFNDSSYGQADQYAGVKFDLKGPDSAYLEFPYGWPLAETDPSYTTPSGFGSWALHRLTALSGGSYFLYQAKLGRNEFCKTYGCRICRGEHKACSTLFDESKLSMVSPDTGPRRSYLERFSREPLYHALLQAWKILRQKEILRGPPALKISGKNLRENREQGGSSAQLSGTSWKHVATAAKRYQKIIDKVVADLLAAETKYMSSADRRILATAAALLVHLRTLACTLDQLIVFCGEMDRIRRLKAPPSSPGFGHNKFKDWTGEQTNGYLFENIYLCHGGAALGEIQFLGNEPVQKRLRETLEYVDSRLEGHRGTPWETLMRRANITVFRPVVIDPRQTKGRPPSRNRPQGDTAKTPSQPTRPHRPTKGGQGGTGGTASGN